MRRAALTKLAGVTAMLGLAGCSVFDDACTTIGWSSILTVQLEGDPASVSQVQLCIEDVCEPATHENSHGVLGVSASTDQGGGIWQFTVLSAPAEFTVRTLAADGTVLADSAVEPEWARTGGSERCGGPSEATVIVQSGAWPAIP